MITIKEAYCDRCRAIISDLSELEFDLEEIRNNDSKHAELRGKLFLLNYDYAKAKESASAAARLSPRTRRRISKTRRRISKTTRPIEVLLNENDERMKHLVAITKAKNKIVKPNIAKIDIDDLIEEVERRIREKAVSVRKIGKKLIVKPHKIKKEKSEEEERYCCPVCGHVIVRIVYGEIL